MPPAPSQKGTGKKGSGIVRQRSRNTTPNSGPPPVTAGIPPSEIVETEFLELRLETVPSISSEDLADSAASNAVIPDSKTLDGLIARLTKLNDIIENRGQYADRGMRLVANQRKVHFDEMQGNDRRDEDKSRKDGDDDKKANKKKRKANDSLAPQDANTGES